MSATLRISILLMASLLGMQQAESMVPPYPDEIILKAGLMPSFAFAGFQADLVDSLVEIAQEDNVTLKFEMTAIEDFYSPNLALISSECQPGGTTEINGKTYSCDDFDLIVGDFWTTPDRYTRVDYTPALLTSSITAMKYIEKTKLPNLDVTTLSEATRARLPVCVLESSSSTKILSQRFPHINLVPCPQEQCLHLLRSEECFLFATDEMELRSIQTKYPEFEVTGERLSRQLIAWPVSKSLDPTASFLVNRWIYAAISGGVIDDLYFEYFEKKLCPMGTAGRDCELPCDPDHGASNAQGQCICESMRWTGNDCSIEILTELNMIPPEIKGIAYIMFGLNALLVFAGGVWLRFCWERPEVQYSQPFFLALVLVGCLVSTATILAMAQENEGDCPVTACVAIPWLYSLGFSITFGTLFAKIRRIYRIFSREHQRSPLGSNRRTVLSFRDTLATIGKVLILDVVILMLWTAIEPLHWERTVIREDQFGFPLESEGYCTSDWWEIFLGAIVALHVALCAIACYMCYMARNIPSRYCEHKYLTIAMVSNLQVFAIGIPVLIIAGHDPVTLFFVRSAIVWMNDFVVLALIFGNLVYAVHSAKSEGERTDRDKRKVLVSEVVRSIAQHQSTLSIPHRRGSQSHQLQHNIEDLKQDLDRDSDLESTSELNPESTNLDDSDSQSGSAIHAPDGGTLQPSLEKESREKEQAASEITLSGFDSSSNHDDSIIEVPSSNSVRSGDSAARWERPRKQEPSPRNSQGPTMPTRGETLIYQPEEITEEDFLESLQGQLETMVIGDTENWGDIDTEKFHDSSLSIPDRLTSIAEWSDDEEVSANVESPALRKSVASEHAPVMPKRFVSEFESA